MGVQLSVVPELVPHVDIVDEAPPARQLRVVEETLDEARTSLLSVLAAAPPVRETAFRGVKIKDGTRECLDAPRARSLSDKKLLTSTEKELAAGQRMFLNVIANDGEYERPITRGDCLPGGVNEQRPCPFVSCKFHLYLDVKELEPTVDDDGRIVRSASLKLNFPHIPPEEMHLLEETCALDVADKIASGELTLYIEDIGRLTNLGLERIRQVEAQALQEAHIDARRRGLRG